MRIVTVTLNPALDKTAVLDELRPGELNRLRDTVVDAGGKGVNVSKMLAALGSASVATGFAGGGSGEEIERALTAGGIDHRFVRIAGRTRTNLKVMDRGDRLTELNEPGPEIAASELDQLRRTLLDLAGGDSLFVFSGSVPAGVAKDIYAELIRLVRGEGAASYLDADGEAFRAAVEEAPDFIKPNRHELLEYFGVSGEPSHAELAGLCRRLLDKGVRRIALSMGGDGALFADNDGCLFAPALPVEVRSTVGAGDSMVGAIVHAASRGLSWRDAAALAMAASAGAVTTVGTKPPPRHLVDDLLMRVRLLPISR